MTKWRDFEVTIYSLKSCYLFWRMEIMMTFPIPSTRWMYQPTNLKFRIVFKLKTSNDMTLWRAVMKWASMKNH